MLRMELHLLVHNIGFASGALIALAFAAFVYIKDRHAISNITFGLAFLSIAVFCGSHVIGVNIADPYISRNVLMWNISVIWIACFLTHCSFAMVDALKKQKAFLVSMYAAAAALTAIYVIFPSTYLLPSSPKMYFPNYYVAGSLQWIMRIIFDVIVPSYFLGYLIYAYRKADTALKNRLKYFMVALVVGYGLGSLAIPLIYDIQIDPAWASPFVIILALPMAYAIVRYNLMDIRILAKRALAYGAVIAAASFGIFMIGYANYAIESHIPGFPLWVLPLAAGCLATLMGVVAWNKFRESDLLKYEFITIATHKLRTPLTSIKWSAENLSSVVPPQNKTDLDHIMESTERLVELTNIIADTSSEDQDKYMYHFGAVDIADMCRALAKEYAEQAADKHITLMSGDIIAGSVTVNADPIKVKSVLQILMDNALSYTPQGGRIGIAVLERKGTALISISDTGMGMDKEELHRVFSRFYRSSTAKEADTEGMGIGLSIAQRIVDRHGGRMWAESAGRGKGSSFFMSLPLK